MPGRYVLFNLIDQDHTVAHNNAGKRDNAEDRDETHSAYDPDYAHRFWRVLVEVDRVLKQFRTGFIGKCRPVHFFWGSFDLAVGGRRRLMAVHRASPTR